MIQDHKVEIHVEDTNAEATIAKISAIRHHYFNDPFAEELVKGSVKKDVIIHRGYWLRFNVFHRLLTDYISKHDNCVILSLGCGYDTLPFLMHKQFPDKHFKFIETDLSVVVKRKISKIKQSKLIQSLLEDVQINNDRIDAKRYQLYGQDLQQIEQFKEHLNKMNPNQPTLVFAECVLTYIEPQFTSKLLNELTGIFKQLTFVNYEMFNPNDGFGKMMVKNFEYRGCPLVGIGAYPSMEAQKQRLLESGFKRIDIQDMKTLYVQGVDKEERLRIEKLELLDEWEEWNIMQSHYFVSVSENFDEQQELMIRLLI